VRPAAGKTLFDALLPGDEEIAAASDLLMTKRTVIQGGQQCCDFAGCGRHNRHSCLIAEPESKNGRNFSA